MAVLVAAGLGQTVRAQDVTGLALELVAQPELDGVEWDVWRMFAETSSPDVWVGAVYASPGDPAFIFTDGQFYQHPSGRDVEHAAGVETLIPGLVHDTYVTLGSTDAEAYELTSLSPGWHGFDPGFLVVDNAAWFRIPRDPASQSTEDQRVLIGQFTVPRDAVLAAWNLGIGVLNGDPPGSVINGLSLNANGGLFGHDYSSQYGACMAVLDDIDGDQIPDFGIAAPSYDENRGEVSIYSGADRSPLLQLQGENPGDRFGASLATLGDIDDDGRPDILIGAPFNDNSSGNNAGRVYLLPGWAFELPEESQKFFLDLLSRPGQAAGDRFGWSIASGFDVDDDGVNDYVVGAPYNDHRATNAGSVTIFSGADQAVLARRYGKEAGDRFGWSVAGLTGPGPDGLAVGAPWSDHGGENAGRLSVYDGATFQVRFRKSGPAGSRLGYSVACVGTIDGDDYAEVAAGAPWHVRAGHSQSGRVLVYSGVDGQRLLARSGPFGSRFGTVVAPAADVDCDSIPDIVIGAPRHNGPAGHRSGLLRVISGATGATLFEETGGQTGGQFGGSAVVVSDDIAEGQAAILVGSPGGGPAAIGFATIIATDPCVETATLPASSRRPGAANPGDRGVMRQRADLDANGVVDSGDLALLIANLDAPACDADGDLNGDDLVSVEDLAIVLDRFGAIELDARPTLPVRIVTREAGDAADMASAIIGWTGGDDPDLDGDGTVTTDDLIKAILGGD